MKYRWEISALTLQSLLVGDWRLADATEQEALDDLAGPRPNGATGSLAYPGCRTNRFAPRHRGVVPNAIKDKHQVHK